MTPWNYNWWNILEINSRIRYVCKREMGFFTFLFGKRKPKWKSITRDYLFITTCEIMWSWWRNKIPIPSIGQVIFYPDPDWAPWAQCNRPHLDAVSRHPGTPVPNSYKNLKSESSLVSTYWISWLYSTERFQFGQGLVIYSPAWVLFTWNRLCLR